MPLKSLIGKTLRKTACSPTSARSFCGTFDCRNLSYDDLLDVDEVGNLDDRPDATEVLADAEVRLDDARHRCSCWLRGRDGRLELADTRGCRDAALAGRERT